MATRTTTCSGGSCCSRRAEENVTVCTTRCKCPAEQLHGGSSLHSSCGASAISQFDKSAADQLLEHLCPHPSLPIFPRYPIPTLKMVAMYTVAGRQVGSHVVCPLPTQSSPLLRGSRLSYCLFVLRRLSCSSFSSSPCLHSALSPLSRSYGLAAARARTRTHHLSMHQARTKRNSFSKEYISDRLLSLLSNKWAGSSCNRWNKRARRTKSQERRRIEQIDRLPTRRVNDVRFVHKLDGV